MFGYFSRVLFFTKVWLLFTKVITKFTLHNNEIVKTYGYEWRKKKFIGFEKLRDYINTYYNSAEYIVYLQDLPSICIGNLYEGKSYFACHRLKLVHLIRHSTFTFLYLHSAFILTCLKLHPDNQTTSKSSRLWRFFFYTIFFKLIFSLYFLLT